MVSQNKKILVVDDDSDIREVICMTMEIAGYDTVGIGNGSQVLEAATSNSPDLILLDVMLGDADGRDICIELKNNIQTSKIPVIILSATHGWHTRFDKNCGADGYMEKPFDIDQLIRLVNKYLRPEDHEK